MCYDDDMDNGYSIFKAADQKYRNGNHITDGELLLLIGRYKAAHDALRDAHNENYRLVENDLYQRLWQLEGFRNARAESKRMKVAK